MFYTTYFDWPVASMDTEFGFAAKMVDERGQEYIDYDIQQEFSLEQ